MADLNKTPEHWHQRAAEMRALAEMMENREHRAAMLRLADDYDKLADRAAGRASDPAGGQRERPQSRGN
jgi:hypothetical protein